jgi:hypothetical protein
MSNLVEKMHPELKKFVEDIETLVQKKGGNPL